MVLRPCLQGTLRYRQGPGDHLAESPLSHEAPEVEQESLLLIPQHPITISLDGNNRYRRLIRDVGVEGEGRPVGQALPLSLKVRFLATKVRVEGQRANITEQLMMDARNEAG